MYKLTIEEVIGEVRKITTLETEDVELVKLILLKEEAIYVESDVPNLNIDPEWQELMQWYREKKAKEQPVKISENKELMEELRKMREEGEKRRRGTISPLNPPYESPSHPWTIPYDPYNPFIVTC